MSLGVVLRCLRLPLQCFDEKEWIFEVVGSVREEEYGEGS